MRDAIRTDPAQDGLLPARMTEPTRLVPWSEAAGAYAAPSFQRGRGWLDATCDLMRRIHADFEFEPGATTVSTSVDEVLYQRRGVCQDFAHLMLACLRGHGLPARYVSGYLLTDPPPGRAALLGADASHAWVAAYAPEHGWVEFDPTNDQLADQRYITLAWGGDFADVVPLRGVILGGRDRAWRSRSASFPTEHRRPGAPSEVSCPPLRAAIGGMSPAPGAGQTACHRNRTPETSDGPLHRIVPQPARTLAPAAGGRPARDAEGACAGAERDAQGTGLVRFELGPAARARSPRGPARRRATARVDRGLPAGVDGSLRVVLREGSASSLDGVVRPMHRGMRAEPY